MKENLVKYFNVKYVMCESIQLYRYKQMELIVSNVSSHKVYDANSTTVVSLIGHLFLASNRL